MPNHYFDPNNPQFEDPMFAQEGDFILNTPNKTINGQPAIDTSLLPFSVGSGALGTYDSNYGWSGARGNRVWVKGNIYEEFLFDGVDIRGVNGNPVEIINYGGQVEARVFSWRYLEHTNISGKYDPAKGYGDINFKGHDAGYAHSGSKYGFYANNRWRGIWTTYTNPYTSEVISLYRYHDNLWYVGGINPVTGRNANNMDISYFAVAHGGFAGIMAKVNYNTNPITDLHFHDGIVQDTDAEGTYIGQDPPLNGSTYTSPQNKHLLYNCSLYNMRFVRNGGEPMQIHTGIGFKWYNNAVIAGAANWRNAWSQSQDSLIQIAHAGKYEIYNNIMIGGRPIAGGILPAVFQGIEAEHIANNPPFIDFNNNYFDGGGGSNMYWSRGYEAKDIWSEKRFNNNFVDESKNRTNEVYTPGVSTDPNAAYYASWFAPTNNLMNYGAVTMGKYQVKNNRIYPQRTLPNSSQYIEVQNNVIAAPDKPQFNNSGFPDNFDYSLLSQYTDYYFKVWYASQPRNPSIAVATGWPGVHADVLRFTKKAMTPVYYPDDAIVSHHEVGEVTKFYKLKAGQTGVDGNGIPINPTDELGEIAWELYPTPADDYSLVEGSTYGLLGLSTPIVIVPTGTTGTTGTTVVSGITFNNNELIEWRSRTEIGPYKELSDSFVNSPAVYGGIVSISNSLTSDLSDDYYNGDWSNSSPIQLLGFKTMMAGFEYLMSGDTTKGNLAKSKILNQIAAPNVQWDDRPIHPTDKEEFAAGAVIRLFHAYEYTMPLYSENEKITIDDWFLSASTYFKTGLNYSLSNYLFPNRLNRDYSIKQNNSFVNGTLDPLIDENYAWIDSGGTKHNIYTNLGAWYNNRRSLLATAMGLLGVYFNDSEMIDQAKLYFEEWLRFAVYPDGTQSEYRRNNDSGGIQPDQGSVGYSSIILECYLLVANALYQNHNDTDMFKFSTQDGWEGTEVGGINGNGRGTKSIYNTLLTFSEHFDGSVIRYRASVNSANSQYASSLRVNDQILAFANKYYKSSYFKSIYKRTKSGTTPYTGGPYGQGPNGWPWGNGLSLVGYPLLYFDVQTTITTNISGVTYSSNDVIEWRRRVNNGFILPNHNNGDWNSIISRSDAILNHTPLDSIDDYRYTALDVTPGGNFDMTYTPAMAFRYLVTGDLTYGNAAKDRLLTQIRMSIADWSQYDSSGNVNPTLYFSGPWYVKLFTIFDYTKNLYSPAEITELEEWFLAGAMFFKECIHSRISQFFPNRASEDYSVKLGYASSGSMWHTGLADGYTHEEPTSGVANRKNAIPNIAVQYSNSNSMAMMGVNLWAAYSDNTELLTHSKIYFEEILKYHVFPDCTAAEYRRNGNYGVQCEGTAFYWAIMVEQLIWYADLMRRKGNLLPYQYTTTDGLWGTEVGGINGFGKGSKSLKNIIETMYENHTLSYPRHSTAPATSGKTELDSWVNNGGVDIVRLPEVGLSMANIYYQEKKLQDMYLNVVGHKYSSTMNIPAYEGLKWGGSIGQLPAFPFMMYNMETTIQGLYVSRSLRKSLMG